MAKNIITLLIVFMCAAFGATAQADKGTAEFDKAAGYYEGQKYKEALQWYKKAAAKGNIEAMEALAEMYTEGLGTNADLKVAKTWQTKAEKAAEKADKLESRGDEDEPEKKSVKRSAKRDTEEEEEED